MKANHFALPCADHEQDVEVLVELGVVVGQAGEIGEMWMGCDGEGNECDQRY